MPWREVKLKWLPGSTFGNWQGAESTFGCSSRSVWLGLALGSISASSSAI